MYSMIENQPTTFKMTKFDQTISLPSNEESKKYDYKMHFSTFLMIAGIFTFFLIRTWWALALISSIVFGCIHLLSRATCKVELNMEADRLILSVLDKENRCVFQEQIQTYQFSWNYRHIPYTFVGMGEANHGSLIFNSTHGNLILLKMELLTVEGKLLMISRELAPWQGIPEDWDYKLTEDEYTENYILSGNMEKLRKTILSSSHLEGLETIVV